MELLLNLAWLSVSIALVAWWLGSVRRLRSRVEWRTVIALGLLVLLLFPAISMTDDLLAMSAPVEVEHLLGSHEEAVLNLSFVTFMDAVAQLPFAPLGNLLPGIASASVLPHTFAATILARSVRAFGVRPPTLHVS